MEKMEKVTEKVMENHGIFCYLKSTNPVYHVLLMPHFDYCCDSAWGDLNKGLSNKLQQIQDRVARIITGASYEIRLKDILHSLGRKTLAKCRDLTVATLMYKCVNNMAPNYLKELFKNVYDVPSYNLRGSSHNLFLPRVNIEYGKNSFSFRGEKFGVTPQRL